MKFSNIKILGYKPEFAVPIHGRDPNVSNPLTDIYNKIVDNALNRFLTPDESDQVINGYRRSAWNEDALKEDINRLDSDEHPVDKDEHYEKALNHVYNLIKPEKPLQPVHFSDLRHYKWRISTNCGAPFNAMKRWKDYVVAKFKYFQRSQPFENIAHRDLFTEAHESSEPLEISDTRMTKHNLYNELFFIARKVIHRIKLGFTSNSQGESYLYWNTAFARQHLVSKDEPDKVRLVFGAPFTLLAAELMFIWPLQAHLLFMGEKSPLLWGYETILGGWYRLRNYFSRVIPYYGTVFTCDWSGFDRRARHTVIRDIQSRIMRPMFDFSQGYHPTYKYRDSSNPDPRRKEDDLPISEKLENLWNWMCDAILRTPLLMPDGTLLEFQHSGIYSGYMQTQILDSLYNMVMLFTILSRMGFDISRLKLKVQGDDSICLLLQLFIQLAAGFLTLFKHYATYYFGAVMNEKKSELLPTLDHAEVLKYKNKCGIPYRDELSLLAQLRHPERSTTPEALASRCIGIAYAACGQLPRVYMICEDIYNYLTQVRGTIPKQSELDFYFRYIEMSSGQIFRPTAARFPSYHETMSHLMDAHSPVAPSHWPLDHFIGRPGQH
uniref:Replicase n=1 Tax=Entoleuca partitivirus 1 TaxID=2086649 RepID=A0A2L1GGB2_9VIRU|nr:replicase [Entoleuca partitivirus 1]